jgi:hypothetical protein
MESQFSSATGTPKGIILWKSPLVFKNNQEKQYIFVFCS